MKYIRLTRTIAILVVTLACLQSCRKGDDRVRYTLRTPVFKTLTEMRNSVAVTGARSMKTTGKIYITGQYIFMCEPMAGIHIIDNSNRSAPKNIGFINLPGNNDIAVNGNTLYADSYNDLVTFNIKDPRSVLIGKRLNNSLSGSIYLTYRDDRNPDSIYVVAGYNERDTLVSSGPSLLIQFAASPANYNSGAGTKGGSMARYSIAGHYLYVVSSNDLKVFDVSGETPVHKNTLEIGAQIETIYPFKDKLFIGSALGMYVYDISQPLSPVRTSLFVHARSCDPVIADDNFAYVTLRSGSGCMGDQNELDVIDISDIKTPTLKMVYQLNHPGGLSKDGEKLFICDGTSGLRVLTTTDGFTLREETTISIADPFDVITDNHIALVVAKNGLYQFQYGNRKVKLVSHLKTLVKE